MQGRHIIYVMLCLLLLLGALQTFAQEETETPLPPPTEPLATVPSTTFTPLPINTASATMTATATETSSQTNTLTATHTLVAPSETLTTTFTPVASTEILVATDVTTTIEEVTETVQAENNVFQIIGGPSLNPNLALLQQVDTPNTSTININFDDPLPPGVSYTIFSELNNVENQVSAFDCGSLLQGGNQFGLANSACSYFLASDNLTIPTTLSVRVRVDLGDDFIIPSRPITPSRLRTLYNLPRPVAQHLFQIKMFDVNDNEIYLYRCEFNVASSSTCDTEEEISLPNIPVRTIEYIHSTIGTVDPITYDTYLLALDDLSIEVVDNPISCIASSFAQIQGSAPQSSDGDDSCPNPDIEQELEEYGILTEGNWSLLELDEMLQGIEKVALAFQEFSTQPYSSPQEAFKEIMLFETTTQHIVMVKLSPPNDDEFCTTNTVPSGMQRASITCGGGNLFTEFTMVHELGHVFLNQTVDAIPVNVSVMPCQSTTTNEVGFIFCIETPRNDTRGSALRGIPVNTFVFGFISRIRNADQITELVDRFDSSGVYNVSANEFSYSCSDGAMLDSNTGLCTNNIPPTTIVSDWERGERGWDGVQLEGFGACANASNDYTTSNFQQNPCTIIDWILQASSSVDAATLSEIKVVEQEETGADMFLNWIYRSVDLSSDAFSDNEGQDIDIYLNSEGPGDDRFFWMEDVLNEFFSYYQW
ncbi:MAG: hypothetical protein WBC91_14950 [Phototrophicaceae bacterium]